MSYIQSRYQMFLWCGIYREIQENEIILPIVLTAIIDETGRNKKTMLHKYSALGDLVMGNK